MQAIWTEVLAVDTVSADDDFFKLGGDSLMATTLMFHIANEFGIQLNPMEVFEHPTVRDLSSVVTELLGQGQPTEAQEETVL